MYFAFILFVLSYIKIIQTFYIGKFRVGYFNLIVLVDTYRDYRYLKVYPKNDH